MMLRYTGMISGDLIRVGFIQILVNFSDRSFCFFFVSRFRDESRFRDSRNASENKNFERSQVWVWTSACGATGAAADANGPIVGYVLMRGALASRAEAGRSELRGNWLAAGAGRVCSPTTRRCWGESHGAATVSQSAGHAVEFSSSVVVGGRETGMPLSPVGGNIAYDTHLDRRGIHFVASSCGRIFTNSSILCTYTIHNNFIDLSTSANNK